MCCTDYNECPTVFEPTKME